MSYSDIGAHLQVFIKACNMIAHVDEIELCLHVFVNLFVSARVIHGHSVCVPHSSAD